MQGVQGHEHLPAPAPEEPMQGVPAGGRHVLSKVLSTVPLHGEYIDTEFSECVPEYQQQADGPMPDALAVSRTVFMAQVPVVTLQVRYQCRCYRMCSLY